MGGPVDLLVVNLGTAEWLFRDYDSFRVHKEAALDYHTWERHQRQNPRRRKRRFPSLSTLLKRAIFALGMIGLVGFQYYPLPGGCSIKGNISDAGERIYHVPGGEYYDVTRIDILTDETWFCTEGEARAAGWRPSRR